MRLLDLFGMAYLQVQSQEVSNGGVVTITAATTEIITAASMDFRVGDYALLHGRCRTTKGATVGRTLITLFQSAGTAGFDWPNGIDESLGQDMSRVAVGDVWEAWIVGLLRCEAAGSVSFRLSGVSVGSNSTVAIGHGTLLIKRFKA